MDDLKGLKKANLRGKVRFLRQRVATLETTCSIEIGTRRESEDKVRELEVNLRRQAIMYAGACSDRSELKEELARLRVVQSESARNSRLISEQALSQSQYKRIRELEEVVEEVISTRTDALRDLDSSHSRYVDLQHSIAQYLSNVDSGKQDYSHFSNHGVTWRFGQWNVAPTEELPQDSEETPRPAGLDVPSSVPSTTPVEPVQCGESCGVVCPRGFLRCKRLSGV